MGSSESPLALGTGMAVCRLCTTPGQSELRRSRRGQGDRGSWSIRGPLSHTRCEVRLFCGRLVWSFRHFRKMAIILCPQFGGGCSWLVSLSSISVRERSLAMSCVGMMRSSPVWIIFASLWRQSRACNKCLRTALSRPSGSCFVGMTFRKVSRLTPSGSCTRQRCSPSSPWILKLSCSLRTNCAPGLAVAIESKCW